MQILRVENLSKIYGSGAAQVKALGGVSFSVNRGEFVAVVGASGSGKSTLLHMIGGVDRPTSGKVYIEDTDIYSLGETNLAIFRRRQVGLIYQFYNLLPILNVEENVTLPPVSYTHLDVYKRQSQYHPQIAVPAAAAARSADRDQIRGCAPSLDCRR